MYCKYCGAPLDDAEPAVCGACGKAQSDEPVTIPVPPSLEEMPPALDQAPGTPEAAEDASSNTGILYENISLNQQEAQAAVPKKKSKAPVIAAIAAVVCVVIVVAAAYLLMRNNSGNAMDTVVLRCEEQEFELTNAELNYYFWSEYYYLLSYYGDYLTAYTGLDPDTDLSQQMYSDTMTWKDYFVQAALASAEETMSFVFAAQEAGFTLPEEYQTNLDATLDNFETYAVEYGFTDADGNADVLGYLQDSYGEGAEYDSFVTYLTNSYLCAAYSNELYNSLSFTETEVSDYYDQHVDEYEAAGVDKETQMVNVRHILLECDTTDEDAAAETLAQAEDLLAQWQAEDGTEDGFAALAEEYSADGGSNTNGGLYENVYPGQMVTNFNDWCFAEGRQVGDTGIVESDYGYHIMYFSGFGDDYWYQSALADMLYETYNNVYLDITSRYTFLVNSDEITVATPTGYLSTNAAG